MLRYVLAFATAGAVVLPLIAQAQGLIGGGERGYDAGRRALGPIGASSAASWVQGSVP